jgi:DNA modification methylase
MGGTVTHGGPDADESSALAELWNVNDHEARSLTHGFHAYAARLHPSLVRAAIERHSRPGERVLDPFCGSGTVLIEAFARGRLARGLDASPLAVELARARTTTLGAAGREQLVELARAIATEAGELARTRKKPELPAWSRAERERFAPHVLLELLTLRQLVLRAPTDDEGVARALRLCFSSLLGKFTITREEKRLARGMASRLLADRSRELAEGLELLERAAPPGTPTPTIEVGDALRASSIRSGSADLVMTSPPYAGTYDYADLHEVRFRWLGLPIAKFRQMQIGGRTYDTLGTNPRAWTEARIMWLKEIARVLRPTGRALLVVGDGIVGHDPEDARGEIERAARQVGLVLRAWASELRPAPDRHVAAVFGDRARHEHLLLLTRA